MKPITIVAGILAAVVLVAWIGYRALLPRAFVAMGQGALNDAGLVQVTATRVAPTALNFDGQQVEAGPNHDFVLIDLALDVPSGAVDFDDFQLVQRKVSELGTEENVGDNADRDYFFWSYLSSSGDPATEPPAGKPFRARVAFKVPRATTSGYLFFWGLYWGPINLEE